MLSKRNYFLYRIRVRPFLFFPSNRYLDLFISTIHVVAFVLYNLLEIDIHIQTISYGCEQKGQPKVRILHWECQYEALQKYNYLISPGIKYGKCDTEMLSYIIGKHTIHKLNWVINDQKLSLEMNERMLIEMQCQDSFFFFSLCSLFSRSLLFTLFVFFLCSFLLFIPHLFTLSWVLCFIIHFAALTSASSSQFVFHPFLELVPFLGIHFGTYVNDLSWNLAIHTKPFGRHRIISWVHSDFIW